MGFIGFFNLHYMDRIYHRYEKWECFKNGFFRNVSGQEKISLSEKVIELFNDSEKTKEFMLKVISEWKHSCEHNLSNLSLNRVAWLGQSACCIYAKIPYSITMENWRNVPKDKQDIACDIAEKIIKEYELCLKSI